MEALGRGRGIHRYLVMGVMFLLMQPLVVPGKDFNSRIAGVLYDKCHGCHNEKKSKGNYRVDRIGLINEPGESNIWPIKPGSLNDSHLWKLINHPDPDQRMPLDADPLPREEKSLIREWIVSGEIFDGIEPDALLAGFLPRPEYPVPPENYPAAYPAYSMAFSPDSQWIATAGYHEILIHPTGIGERSGDDLVSPTRIQGLPERIHAILWPTQDSIIVAGGNPGRLGELIHIRFNKAGAGEVIPLALTEDSFFAIEWIQELNSLFALGADGQLSQHSWPDGSLIRKLNLHSDWGNHLSAQKMGDSWTLFSSGRDKSVKSVNLASQKLQLNLTGFKSSPARLAIHPNHKLGIGLDSLESGSLLSWHIEKESIQNEIKLPKGKDNTKIVATALTRIGKWLVVGDKSGMVHLSNQDWKSFPTSMASSDSRVISMAPSKDDSFLAVAHISGNVQILSMPQLKKISHFVNQPGSLESN